MNKIWYLSPSNEGKHSEQLYLLVDKITPHLDRCGVSFVVADREKDPGQRAAEAHAVSADCFLALCPMLNSGENNTKYAIPGIPVFLTEIDFPLRCMEQTAMDIAQAIVTIDRKEWVENHTGSNFTSAKQATANV